MCLRRASLRNTEVLCGGWVLCCSLLIIISLNLMKCPFLTGLICIMYYFHRFAGMSQEQSLPALEMTAVWNSGRQTIWMPGSVLQHWEVTDKQLWSLCPRVLGSRALPSCPCLPTRQTGIDRFLRTCSWFETILLWSKSFVPNTDSILLGHCCDVNVQNLLNEILDHCFRRRRKM